MKCSGSCRWLDSPARRSPCGERGLKCRRSGEPAGFYPSLPVRGAWIEILRKRRGTTTTSSLPVRGAWIEIPRKRRAAFMCSCRSPCGERGLKYRQPPRNRDELRSLPVRGAWIEINQATCRWRTMKGRSPCGERGLKSESPHRRMRSVGRSPCGERGLKYRRRRHAGHRRRASLPVRGAWIEIMTLYRLARDSKVVAPRAGSVD